MLDKEKQETVQDLKYYKAQSLLLQSKGVEEKVVLSAVRKTTLMGE